MNEIDKFELIEQFVMGKLKGKDLEAFTQQIEQNPELAAEVDLHRDLIESLKETEVDDFRKTLKSIQNKVNANEQTTAKILPLRHTLVIAAAVLFLILAAYGLWQLSVPSTASLYATHFEAASDLNVVALTRNSSNDDEKASARITAWTKINDYYREGEYAQTLKALAGFKKQFPNWSAANSNDLNFQKAMILMANEQLVEAIPLLEGLKKDKRFEERRHWYLGLAYLKVNQLEAARVEFEQLENRSLPKRWEKQVSELLKYLKRSK